MLLFNVWIGPDLGKVTSERAANTNFTYLLLVVALTRLFAWAAEDVGSNISNQVACGAAASRGTKVAGSNLGTMKTLYLHHHTDFIPLHHLNPFNRWGCVLSQARNFRLRVRTCSGTYPHIIKFFSHPNPNPIFMLSYEWSTSRNFPKRLVQSCKKDTIIVYYVYLQLKHKQVDKNQMWWNKQNKKKGS